MSRIEPIRRSHALVRTARGATQTAGRIGPDPAPAETRRRRPSTLARSPLGDAAAAAAFEVHRIANGGGRGLKADLGVRRQWSQTYRAAVEGPQPRPTECARA